MTPHTPPAKRWQLAASVAAAIPEDILVSEVLARLPVRSLLRFRSVCRSWRAAIDGDPRLVRHHLELSRGQAPPSVLDVPCEPRLEDHWGEARSKEMEFRRIRHGAAVDAELMLAAASPANRFTAVIDPVHCDGMVLVPTASGELFVCNPATRELVALPPGSRSVMRGAVAFGFDPSSNTYKAARIFYRGVELVEADDDEGGEGVEEYDVGHEVLTLGADSSWEPTDDPPYYVAPIRPICTRGAFYWTAAVGRADDPRPTELLRFCLRDKTFAVVPNPPCFFQSVGGLGLIGNRDTLTELGGRLCCAHARTATGVDIWLADDDGPRLEWSMAHRIELLRPVAHSVLPLAADGDELLLSVDRRVLYKYSAASKAVEEVLDMQRVPDLYGGRPPLPLRLVHHAVPYVESLVSITRHNY
ncbi:hypothetical protein PAHAL_7G107100 [Panicum hallii]|jgi:F-box interacting protein|uniref:F-box domain-containing protein n=1 Tax=Panicum hallii TaxID=206008 RepID=A0A2T8IBR4_9POAL|nr:F-box protein At3g07870-like [Panicum hallii]PVH35112.1 hypothetical protein PAHAL_7G107100 [Panicum hallii]